MTKRNIKRDPILAMASMLGAEPAAATKPRTPWSVGEVQRPDAGGPLYAPVRVLNNEFIEHGMTPSHDRATMERAVEQLNATPKQQHRTLSTRAVAIIGNAKEWNIVTEAGGHLERFTGTMGAARRRAQEWHQNRVTSLVARALNATWQAIGSDIESSCKSAGVRLTNASAYESTLDCGHLEQYGPGHGKDKLTMDAINEFRKLPYAEQLRITRKMLGKLV